MLRAGAGFILAGLIPYIDLGPFSIGTFGLLLWLSFVAAYFLLRADAARRGSAADPHMIIGFTALAGIVGAKLWHVLERPADLAADPFGVLFDRAGFAWFGGLLLALLALYLMARKFRMAFLEMMDLCAPAAAVGYAVGRIGCLLSGDGDYGQPTTLPWCMSFPNGLVPTNECVHPTPIYEAITNGALGWYLWRRGARSLREPRPVGEVGAEFLLWSGVLRFLVEFVRINPPVLLGMSNAQVASLLSVAAGVAILVTAKKQFRAQKGEHRIVEHYLRRGDVMQPEYHRATPECPNPERWRMYDSMTAEVEVLEFLKTLVTTVKPKLIYETGTFMGVSTLWMAEAVKKNGFGRIVTCEYDAKVFAQAKQRIDASGLGRWIEYRNESSLETKIDGQVDLFFSDSDPPIREAEVRRFLPHMNPNGLILMHDASSHLKTVREAALRLQAEGLVSVVLLPTPRGLVIAQKRPQH